MEDQSNKEELKNSARDDKAQGVFIAEGIENRKALADATNTMSVAMKSVFQAPPPPAASPEKTATQTQLMKKLMAAYTTLQDIPEMDDTYINHGKGLLAVGVTKKALFDAVVKADGNKTNFVTKLTEWGIATAMHTGIWECVEDCRTEHNK